MSVVLVSWLRSTCRHTEPHTFAALAISMAKQKVALPLELELVG